MCSFTNIDSGKISSIGEIRLDVVTNSCGRSSILLSLPNRYKIKSVPESLNPVY